MYRVQFNNVGRKGLADWWVDFDHYPSEEEIVINIKAKKVLASVVVYIDGGDIFVGLNRKVGEYTIDKI